LWYVETGAGADVSTGTLEGKILVGISEIGTELGIITVIVGAITMVLLVCKV
jgi:hypothetical protein